MLDVRQDNVVGSLATDIHKRWGVTLAEQRLFREGLLLPLDMPLRHLDNGATIQMQSPVVITMISDTLNNYKIEVLPRDDVESVKYDVQRRWEVVPSKQRLFVEGRPLAQETDLEHLGKGAKILHS